MLFVLAFIVSGCLGASRYFVDDTVSFSNMLPIGVCMPTITYRHIQYECDISHPNYHIVTRYNHSIDYPNCDSPNPIITTYTKNITLNRNVSDYSFELHSFNCVGEDNYVEMTFYADIDGDHAALCASHAKEVSDRKNVTNFAGKFTYYWPSKLCFPFSTIYIYFECNGYHATEFNFAQADCNASSAIFADYWYRNCFADDGNIRASKCVSNGSELTPYSYSEEDGTLPTEQRIALIDIYFDTHLDSPSLTYTTLCSSLGLLYDAESPSVPWNITQIAFEGHAYVDETEATFCGIETQYIYDNTTTNDTFLSVTTINIRNWLEETGVTASMSDTICDFHDLQKFLLIQGDVTEELVPSEELASVGLSYEDVPSFVGTIPSCLWDLQSLDWFILQGTNIEGQISEAICDTSVTFLMLQRNIKIVGTLPECIGNMELTDFWLRNMHGLEGTIPENIFCNSILETLMIQNNSKLDDQYFPECFSDDKELFWLQIADSNFIGTIPPLPVTPFNSSNWLQTPHLIDLSGNKFVGTISEMFSKYDEDAESAYSWITSLFLHNGNFYEEDISVFLGKLFAQTWFRTSWQPIQQISISNNPNIKGSLPDIDETVYFQYEDIGLPLLAIRGITEISVFSAHNCNLYGTIPPKLKFKNLNLLTLHNNHISGYIPAEFTDAAVYPYTYASYVTLYRNYFPDLPDAHSGHYPTMILLGNKMWTDSDGLPEWDTSPFSTAPNLYYSSMQLNQGIFIVVFAGLSIAFFVVWHFINRKIKFKDLDAAKNNQQAQYFFNAINYVQTHLCSFNKINYPFGICVVILLIFCPFNANYYVVNPVHSLFSLSWYAQDDTTKWINWILVIIAVVYNFSILSVVSSLCFHISQNKIESVPQLSPTAELQDYDINIEDNENNQDTNSEISMGKRCLKIVLFVLLWITGICIIIIYIISKSLPDKNVIGLDATVTVLISGTIALILIVNNKYIVPGLVKNISFSPSLVKYQVHVMLVLRLINSIFLPFIASVFLLNDCGKYWVNLWDYCNDTELMAEFDVFVFSTTISQKWTILSSADVCSTPSISEMDFDRCIRSFFDDWTVVIMLKLVYSFFIQIASFGSKILRQKFSSKEMKIDMDENIMAIILNLLTSITFSFIAPLIIPLTLMNVTLKLFLFKVMYYKFDWKLNLKHIKVNDQFAFTIPIYLLFIGILLSQIMTLLFIIFSVNDTVISTAFCVLLGCVDTFCVYKYVTTSKSVSNSNMNGNAIEFSNLANETKSTEKNDNNVETKQVSSVTEIQQTTKQKELQDWLHNTVALPEYYDVFVNNGFEDLESLYDITMDELQQIGIVKLGHRKKLVKFLKQQV